jgi:hypothetical protein
MREELLEVPRRQRGRRDQNVRYRREANHAVEVAVYIERQLAADGT